MRIDVMLVLAGLGASAQAQSWVWMADVPDGTVLGPGDSITVTLSAAFDSGGGEPFQVIAATIFDTLNIVGAEQGEPLMEGDWDVLHNLDALTGDLTTTDGSSLINTNAGQFPYFPFYFTGDNPVDVLRFTWTASDEASGGDVSFTTSTSAALIWVGREQNDVDAVNLIDHVCEASFGWTVVPAPGSVAVLGIAGLALGRRRR
jgi:hypothetical protein